MSLSLLPAEHSSRQKGTLQEPNLTTAEAINFNPDVHFQKNRNMKVKPAKQDMCNDKQKSFVIMKKTKTRKWQNMNKHDNTG